MSRTSLSQSGAATPWQLLSFKTGHSPKSGGQVKEKGSLVASGERAVVSSIFRGFNVGR
jgi:hypothetical protein